MHRKTKRSARQIAGVLLMLAAASSAWAQAGNGCADATPLSPVVGGSALVTTPTDISAFDSIAGIRGGCDFDLPVDNVDGWWVIDGSQFPTGTRFTVDSSQTTTADGGFGPNDTVIEVYRGSCAALTVVGCSDDVDFAGGDLTSSVAWSNDGTSTYYILGTQYADGPEPPVWSLTVVATPPPADNADLCANAAVFTDSVQTKTLDMASYTSQVDFQTPDAPTGGRDAFFRFTPATTGTYQFSFVFDPPQQMAWSAWTAADCAALQGGTATSIYPPTRIFSETAVNVPLTGGTEYFLVLEDNIPTSVPGLATVSYAFVTAPANDDCTGAISLGTLSNGDAPVSVTTPDLNLATDSGIDPPAIGTNDGRGPDVFYTLTAGSTGTYRVTLGGFAGFAVGTYSGSCAALAPVASGLASSATTPAAFTFEATTGTTYYILADTAEAITAGTGTITIEAIGELPPGASCARPIEATGTGDPLVFELTVDTSSNPNGTNPTCAGSGNDGWVRFPALPPGPYILETFDAGDVTDTVAALYSGDCATLVPVACDDDGGEGLFSTFQFTAQAGQTYTALVESFGSGGGQIGLRVRQLVPAANDDCANASPIDPSRLPFVGPVALDTATDSGIDNSASVGFGGGQGRDVFFSFTPTETGRYRVATGIDPAGRDVDAGLAILTGDCANLTEVAAFDFVEGAENGIVELEAGVAYTVLAEGFNAAVTTPTDFGIDGPLPVATSNDVCTGSLELTTADIPYSKDIDTRGNLDQVSGFGSNGPDTWYRLTATEAGVYNIEVSPAAGFDPSLVLLTDDCDALTFFTGSSTTSFVNVGGPGSPEKISATMSTGQTVLILIDSYNVFGGEAVVSITRDVPATNDNCETAKVLDPVQFPTLEPVELSRATDSGLDNSASVGFGGGAGRDVFFRFTPATTGRYRVATGFLTGLDVDTGIGVYAGNCPLTPVNEVFAEDNWFGSENPVFTLNAGVSYTVMVEGFDATIVDDTDAVFAGPVPASSGNDDCTSATAVSLPYSTMVDVRGNVNTYRPVVENNGPNAFYTVTATTTGPHTFEATPLAFTEDVYVGVFVNNCAARPLAFFTGSAATSLADANGNGESETITVNMTAGQTALVVVGYVTPLGAETMLNFRSQPVVPTPTPTPIPTPTPTPGPGQDTDGDGWSDNFEGTHGSSPTDPASQPTAMDLNSDGEINMLDVLIMYRQGVGLDLNGDSVVNDADATIFFEGRTGIRAWIGS